MTNPLKNSKRIPSLDGLRAISILLIFVSHEYHARSQQTIFSDTLAQGGHYGTGGTTFANGPPKATQGVKRRRQHQRRCPRGLMPSSTNRATFTTDSGPSGEIMTKKEILSLKVGDPLQYFLDDHWSEPRAVKKICFRGFNRFGQTYVTFEADLRSDTCLLGGTVTE